MIAQPSALLVIDMQEDFVRSGAVAEVPGSEAIIANIAILLAAWRDRGWPIFHVIRFYSADGSDAELSRRDAVAAGLSIVRPGSGGAQIAEGLLMGPPELDAQLLLAGGLQAVGSREWVMYKSRWSAFHKTPLEQALRGEGVEGVVVCGCNLPNCPRATLFGATARDFRGVLVADATSQATKPRLDDLALIGVEVVSTDAVLKHLAEMKGTKA